MMRLVLSEVKRLVENVEITTAQASAGHQRLSQSTIPTGNWELRG